jgi:hypothetical protein
MKGKRHIEKNTYGTTASKNPRYTTFESGVSQPVCQHMVKVLAEQIGGNHGKT